MAVWFLLGQIGLVAVVQTGCKFSHHINHQTSLQACQFYESDEVSRLMPGKKDFVFMKQEFKYKNDCNLKELYQLFKDSFPSEKVGFSKFAGLRPKHLSSSWTQWNTLCLHLYYSSKCKVNDKRGKFV